MVKAKILKLHLDGYGCYLGRGEGCFEVRDKDKNVTRYPHFEREIGEAVLKSGSYVSADALIDLALWNIDTYIMTRGNRIVVCDVQEFAFHLVRECVSVCECVK